MHVKHDGQVAIEKDICGLLSLNEIETNITTNETLLRFSYSAGPINLNIDGKMQDLVSNSFGTFLAKNSVLVKDKYLEELQDYLTDAYYDMIQRNNVKFTHDQVGWDFTKGVRAYFLGKSINTNVQSEYCGSVYSDIGEAGSYEEYMKMIETEVLPNDNLKMALALGFSAPISAILAKYTPVKTLVANAFGEHGTGKSTSFSLMASIWGSGDIDNSGIVKTFNATKNALITVLSGLEGFPMLFDDDQCRDKEAMSEEFWKNFAYLLDAGSEKMKNESGGKLQKDLSRWRTTVIIGGESSVLSKAGDEQGSADRILEFGEIKWTSSAENAENITKCVKNNYGFLGPQFIAGLAKVDDETIQQTYDESLNEIDSHLKVKNTSRSRRLSQRGAVLLTTAKLVNQTLGLDLNAEYIKNYLVNLINDTGEQESIAQKVLSEVLQFLVVNSSKIVNYAVADGGKPVFNSGTDYGKYNEFPREDGTNDRVITIVVDVLNKHILDRMTEKRRILKEWKNSGVLICDENRNVKSSVRFGKLKTDGYSFDLRKVMQFLNIQEDESQVDDQQYLNLTLLEKLDKYGEWHCGDSLRAKLEGEYILKRNLDDIPKSQRDSYLKEWNKRHPESKDEQSSQCESNVETPVCTDNYDDTEAVENIFKEEN